MTSLHLPEDLSPDSIDTLTELAQILTRLRAAQSAAAATTGSSSLAGGAAAGLSSSSAVAPGKTTTPSASGGVAAAQTSAPTTAPVTGTTPLPSALGPPSSTGAGVAGGGGAGGAGGGALSLKDIPTATDNLKHKLQRARARLRALPDMDRTAAEQGAELRELEARIAAQREVLAGLRDMGLRFGSEESVTVGGSGGGGGGGDRMVM